MNKNNFGKGIVRSAIALTLVLCTLLSLTSCVISFPGIQRIPESSVAHIVSESGELPDFDRNVLYLIETCFDDYYYTDIPDNETLARGTIDAYNEFCREQIESTDADRDAITHAIVDCYIYSIGDKYSFYRTKDESEEYSTDMSGSFVGIGVSVIRNDLEGTILVQSVEIGSPAEKGGIKADDYIVGVNGERVSEIGTAETVNKIRGEIGTEVTVTVLRGEEEINITMVRAKITETTVSHKLIEDGRIGYIRITGFKSNTAAQFIDTVNACEEAGVEGIIFDLRSNPGGYLDAVVSMLSYLVPSDTPIVSFSSDKAAIDASHGDGFEQTDHKITVPSAILCNENSASAAELFTAAMRDYDDMGLLTATVIGTVTYKKGIMQSTIPFSNGASLTLTTALYNPPSGINFHGVGVTPDVLIESGLDEDYMSAAIAALSSAKEI